jgi:hypothetical protein
MNIEYWPNGGTRTTVANTSHGPAPGVNLTWEAEVCDRHPISLVNVQVIRNDGHEARAWLSVRETMNGRCEFCLTVQRGDGETHKRSLAPFRDYDARARESFANLAKSLGPGPVSD